MAFNTKDNKVVPLVKPKRNSKSHFIAILGSKSSFFSNVFNIWLSVCTL